MKRKSGDAKHNTNDILFVLWRKHRVGIL